ncbi:hypothetical protein HPP92_006173 [Vanilla planifolia]|uniref:Uncharacterized protein n=1 Tax=Vanilla planifolia TaxID=51239 RepID=A0A835RTF7_VANPL|nr:hypothetical protein HPP92_006173 [Vanilla planifolia]
MASSHEDVHFSDPTKSLLPNSSSSSPSPRTALIHTKSLILISSIVISSTSFVAAVAFAFLLLSSPTVLHLARPLSKLPRPTVILMSFDGFRFGYHLKAPTPNICRLISNGTSAEDGLIPVFPSITFPNQYSIATGLFPPHHGIINNYFSDPVSGDRFFTTNNDPKWWLGEPLWQTVARHGLHAAAIFWAGCEVKKGSWTCPPKFCPKYNSFTFEERVDAALGFFDLPAENVPVLVMLYFQDPDSQGHVFGPDHPEITKAVARMDAVLGRLIAGLEQRNIFEDVTIILLGDHGMAGTCDEKYIFLEELFPWIHIGSDWVFSADTLLTIQPPPEISSQEALAKMRQGLSSGKVRNGDKLRLFLKEDLPESFHYAASERIPSIVGIVEEGYMVKYKREKQRYGCGGGHGYDHSLMSMRSFFVAHGPRLPQGKQIPSFQNVEVYNLVTAILKLDGAPNNGSSVFPSSILLQENP